MSLTSPLDHRSRFVEDTIVQSWDEDTQTKENKSNTRGYSLSSFSHHVNDTSLWLGDEMTESTNFYEIAFTVLEETPTKTAKSGTLTIEQSGFVKLRK